MKKKYLGPNLLKLRVEDKHAASFQDVKMFFLRRCQIWTRHIGHIYQKSEKFVSSKILFYFSSKILISMKLIRS